MAGKIPMPTLNYNVNNRPAVDITISAAMFRDALTALQNIADQNLDDVHDSLDATIAAVAFVGFDIEFLSYLLARCVANANPANSGPMQLINMLAVYSERGTNMEKVYKTSSPKGKALVLEFMQTFYLPWNPVKGSLTPTREPSIQRYAAIVPSIACEVAARAVHPVIKDDYLPVQFHHMRSPVFSSMIPGPGHGYFPEAMRQLFLDAHRRNQVLFSYEVDKNKNVEKAVKAAATFAHLGSGSAALKDLGRLLKLQEWGYLDSTEDATTAMTNGTPVTVVPAMEAGMTAYGVKWRKAHADVLLKQHVPITALY